MSIQSLRKLAGTELFLVFLGYAYYWLRHPAYEQGYEKIQRNVDNRNEESSPYNIGKELWRIFADHTISIIMIIWSPKEADIVIAYIHFLVVLVYIFLASKGTRTLKKLGYVLLCILNLILLFRGVFRLL